MRKLFSFIARYTDEISLTIIGVFIYFAAGSTQSGWLYYILALIAALMILGFAIPRLSLSHLEITRDLPSMCYEDDEIAITLTVRNGSRWRRPFIYIREYLPTHYFSGEKERLFPVMSLSPGEERSITYTVKCLQRGLVTFSRCELGCSYPFGLFPASAKVQASHFLSIFPRGPHIEKLGLLSPFAPAILFGQHRSLSFAGRSFDFMGIREYSPFDGTRFIHWPSTARLGKLMVKEFNDASHTRMILVVDANVSASMGEGRENSLEYAIRAAASIVEYAYRSRIPVTLLSGADNEIHVLQKPAKLQVLQYLASMSASCSLLPDQIVKRYLESDSAQSRLAGHMIMLQCVPAVNRSVMESLQARRISLTLMLFDGSSFCSRGSQKYAAEKYDEALEVCAASSVACRILRKGDSLKSLLESDI